MVVLDNLVNSSAGEYTYVSHSCSIDMFHINELSIYTESLNRVVKIAAVPKERVTFVQIDLCDKDAVASVFEQFGDG